MALLDQKSLTRAKVFGITGAIMPFVMYLINYIIDLFISTTDVSGVQVNFSIAQLNLRNAISSGGHTGQISDWLAGLFGYTVPDAVANLPGSGILIPIINLPLSALLAGAIVGAIGGIAAHWVISNLDIVKGMVPNSGVGLYIGYALVASIIGYVIILIGSGLPNFIGGLEIAMAMLVNAIALGYVAKWVATKV